jgi:hypothetical protein
MRCPSLTATTIDSIRRTASSVKSTHEWFIFRQRSRCPGQAVDSVGDTMDVSPDGVDSDVAERATVHRLNLIEQHNGRHPVVGGKGRHALW